MQTLFDNFAAWHESHSHLVRALIAGVLVSTVCGVIGCFIILRRMAFLGDALAHAMLAGVVSVYLLMKVAGVIRVCRETVPLLEDAHTDARDGS